MTFRILCLGDIVGEPARRVLTDYLPTIKREQEIDFVIANGENMANGSGITERLYKHVRSAGVDVVTSGDHIWKQKEIIAVIDRDNHLVRPANLPIEAHGKGSRLIETTKGLVVGVINLQGRLYMDLVDCPFHAAMKELKKLEGKADLIVVDMHAEATSEKVAMGWYLAEKIDILFGTHTHIPTADARILKDRCAYITDVGMCGAYYSVIGRQIEPVLQKFVTSIPAPFHVATEDVRLCGLLTDYDLQKRKVISTERFEFKP